MSFDVPNIVAVFRLFILLHSMNLGSLWDCLGVVFDFFFVMPYRKESLFQYQLSREDFLE